MSTLRPAAIAATYSVAPPARYLRFYDKREFAGLGRLQLKQGFLEGDFDTQLNSSRLLRDIEGLTSRHHFPPYSVARWLEEFPGLVPLSVLDEARFGVAGGTPSGAFLAVRLNRPACPVYVVVREGPAALPLASSLDAFIRGQAWRDARADAAFVQGAPFFAFGWGKARPATQGGTMKLRPRIA